MVMFNRPCDAAMNGGDVSPRHHRNSTSFVINSTSNNTRNFLSDHPFDDLPRFNWSDLRIKYNRNASFYSIAIYSLLCGMQCCLLSVNMIYDISSIQPCTSTNQQHIHNLQFSHACMMYSQYWRSDISHCYASFYYHTNLPVILPDSEILKHGQISPYEGCTIEACLNEQNEVALGPDCCNGKIKRPKIISPSNDLTYWDQQKLGAWEQNEILMFWADNGNDELPPGYCQWSICHPPRIYDCYTAIALIGVRHALPMFVYLFVKLLLLLSKKNITCRARTCFYVANILFLLILLFDEEVSGPTVQKVGFDYTPEDSLLGWYLQHLLFINTHDVPSAVVRGLFFVIYTDVALPYFRVICEFEGARIIVHDGEKERTMEQAILLPSPGEVKIAEQNKNIAIQRHMIPTTVSAIPRLSSSKPIMRMNPTPSATTSDDAYALFQTLLIEAKKKQNVTLHLLKHYFAETDPIDHDVKERRPLCMMNRVTGGLTLNKDEYVFYTMSREALFVCIGFLLVLAYTIFVRQNVPRFKFDRPSFQFEYLVLGSTKNLDWYSNNATNRDTSWRLLFDAIGPLYDYTIIDARSTRFIKWMMSVFASFVWLRIIHRQIESPQYFVVLGTYLDAAMCISLLLGINPIENESAVENDRSKSKITHHFSPEVHYLLSHYLRETLRMADYKPLVKPSISITKYRVKPTFSTPSSREQHSMTDVRRRLLTFKSKLASICMTTIIIALRGQGIATVVFSLTRCIFINNFLLHSLDSAINCLVLTALAVLMAYLSLSSIPYRVLRHPYFQVALNASSVVLMILLRSVTSEVKFYSVETFLIRSTLIIMAMVIVSFVKYSACVCYFQTLLLVKHNQDKTMEQILHVKKIRLASQWKHPKEQPEEPFSSSEGYDGTLELSKPSSFKICIDRLVCRSTKRLDAASSSDESYRFLDLFRVIGGRETAELRKPFFDIESAMQSDVYCSVALEHLRECSNEFFLSEYFSIRSVDEIWMRKTRGIAATFVPVCVAFVYVHLGFLTAASYMLKTASPKSIRLNSMILDIGCVVCVVRMVALMSIGVFHYGATDCNVLINHLKEENREEVERAQGKETVEDTSDTSVVMD